MKHESGFFDAKIASWSTAENRAGELCVVITFETSKGQIPHYCEFSDRPVGSTTKARIAVETLKKCGFEGTSIEAIDTTTPPHGVIKIEVYENNGFTNVRIKSGHVQAETSKVKLAAKKFDSLFTEVKVKSALKQAEMSSDSDGYSAPW